MSETDVLQKPRPEPSDPIHLVLDKLWDLFERINMHSGKPEHWGNNMLQKYTSFIRVSPSGRACTYAMKAKHLFLLSDYDNVKDKLKEAVRAIRSIPGQEDFCKDD